MHRSRPARFPLFGIFLLLAGLASGQLQAAQVAGLFEVDVPVANQQESLRKDALRLAFGQLLAKVTGDPRAAKREELKEEVALAENYAQQYAYRDAAAAGAPGSGTMLHVVFDEAAVTQLLGSHGIPVWGANRPAVIAWIGLHRGSEQRLLTPELDATLRDGVEYGARQAGVPIILPLGDLEDQGRLSPAKLAAPGNEEALRAASERYSPDLIFAGLLNEKPGEGWVGSWSLLTDEGAKRWQNQGANPNALTAEALGKVAETLAAQFAPAAGSAAPEGSAAAAAVELAVSGINNIADYARIKHLLFAMNSAAKVRLQGAESDQLFYQMEARGPLNLLQRELTLGGMLKPGEEDVAGGPGEDGVTHLHYEVAL